MFVYSQKPNNLFGIEGYDIPKKYCDPLRNIKEREILTQKKGQKKKGKIPNKYYDPKNQITPAPNSYNIMKSWMKENKEKRSNSVLSKSRNVSKNTFIDQIFQEAKRIKSPGPGSYNPYKDSQKQAPKRNISKDVEKPSFLCESEYVGALIPGPGFYNPRVFINFFESN